MNFTRNIFNITLLFKNCYDHIDELKNKVEELKLLYSDLITSNSNRKILLFCLESFNFQIKFFSLEIENLNTSYSLITNRVFCDYYKLYKILLKLFADSKYDLPEIQKDYVYNDLCPTEQYGTINIELIYEDVCVLLDTLNGKYKENEAIINQYTLKSQTGICISNVIQTMEYDNSVLKDQIMLYIGYMNFFYKTQMKYINKLLKKITNLKKEANSEIDLNNVSEKPLTASDTISDITENSKSTKKRKTKKQKQLEQVQEEPAEIQEPTIVATNEFVLQPTQEVAINPDIETIIERIQDVVINPNIETTIQYIQDVVINPDSNVSTPVTNKIINSFNTELYEEPLEELPISQTKEDVEPSPTKRRTPARKKK